MEVALKGGNGEVCSLEMGFLSEEKGLVGVRRGRVDGGKDKAACILMEFFGKLGGGLECN